MITLVTSLTLLFLVFLVNFLIIKSTRTRFPKNTEAQNLRATEKTRGAIVIGGIVMIFISILYINVLYKSESQIMAEKEMQKELDRVSAKKIAAEKEIKRFGLTKQEVEILNQHETSVNNLSDEVKNAYSILKSQKYYVDTEIIRFSGLAKKTKNSEFEKRVNKTRDSLIKNETTIGKRQLAESEKKLSQEESAARLKYGEDFRNLLLDRNLDIQVKVFGKDNKKMKLIYALFNDVWFRKFETLGYFDMIHEKGFTHIELSDGYEYGKAMQYGN